MFTLEQEVPRKYLKEIKELGLLEKDEKIIYFYTDALFDIKDGLYFVTDRHLVLYSQEWEEPETIIDYEDITNINVDYNESFFEDTYVMIETISEIEIHFPVSSERGRDKKFVQHIKSKMKKAEQGVAPQSANRPGSKPEGSDKLQLESEERSQ